MVERFIMSNRVWFHLDMSDKNKLAWKRPISRIYPYNLDVGENYYIPMTTYLDNKAQLETPGALTFR